MNHTPFLSPLLFVINSRTVFETPHAFAIKTNVPLPFCNRAGNMLPIDEDDVIAIKNYFDTIPFRWFVESTDTNTIYQLKHHGLSHKISFPAMHIDLQKVQPVVYDSITVKEITEPSDLETWIDIIVKSYGTNAAEFTKFIQYISDNAAPTALHFYTAYYQDIPAAASMVIRSGTTIALHWVGTLPEYRGKGLGYAVSHTPLIDAKHNHATHAVLFASTMGKPIYERLGFRKYALYDVYGL